MLSLCHSHAAGFFHPRFRFFLLVCMACFCLCACSSSSDKDDEEESRQPPPPATSRSPDPSPSTRSSDRVSALPQPPPTRSSDRVSALPQPPMLAESFDDLHQRLQNLIRRTDAMLLKADSDLFDLSAFSHPDLDDLRLQLARQSSALHRSGERLLITQPQDAP